MIRLLARILVLFIIVAGVVLLGNYSDTIRATIAKRFGMYQGQVAGARTSLESELKENVQDTASSIQKQLLQLKVEDAVKAFGQLKKIGNDISNLKEEVLRLSGVER